MSCTCCCCVCAITLPQLISGRTTIDVASKYANFPIRILLILFPAIHCTQGTSGQPKPIAVLLRRQSRRPAASRERAAHGLGGTETCACLLYTSPSPRDRQKSRM